MDKLYKDSKINVIVTVPHGCLGTIIDCDKNASVIAEKAVESLDDAVLLANYKSRNIVDMNRPESRGTAFRKSIDSFLENGDKLLFDIHSYPFYEKDLGKCEINIFDLPTNKDDIFSKKVTEEFENGSLKVCHIKGAEENDIVNTALEKGNNAVLIEFNQKLNVLLIGGKLARVIKKLESEFL